MLITHQRVLSLLFDHITLLLPLILDLLDLREQCSTLVNYFIFSFERCLLFHLNLAIKILHPILHFIF
jgi:hypothetical protein